MPIQFRCARCNEPLEVDDDLAEKMVRCPYCEAVVSVPASSTLQLEEVVTARAGGGPPPPPAIGLPPTAGAAAPRPTNTPLGNAALGCVAMVVICVFAALVYGFMQNPLAGLTSQPANIPSLRDQVRQQMENSSGDSVGAAISCGVMFFLVAGLAFGIAALVRREPGVWRGWTAVGVCGMGLACQVLAAIALVALTR